MNVLYYTYVLRQCKNGTDVVYYRSSLDFEVLIFGNVLNFIRAENIIRYSLGQTIFHIENREMVMGRGKQLTLNCFNPNFKIAN